MNYSCMDASAGMHAGDMCCPGVHVSLIDISISYLAKFLARSCKNPAKSKRKGPFLAIFAMSYKTFLQDGLHWEASHFMNIWDSPCLYMHGTV